MILFKNKVGCCLSTLLFLQIAVFGATVTTTRSSETVDLARLSRYNSEDTNKLQLVWGAFRKQHVFTDDGYFEPVINGADACPDNQETQIAFLNFIKEKSTEVTVSAYIRCGDCNGTGKKYIHEGDDLSSTAYVHIPCNGTGKIEALIIYKLIYNGTPPPRLPTKNQRTFIALEKRVTNGDVDAEFELGQCLDAGRGTSKDFKRASEMYTRCVLRKDPRGAFGLGSQLERGSKDVPSNLPVSIAYYMLGQSLGGGSSYLDNVYREAQPRDVMIGAWYGRTLIKEFKTGKLDSQRLSAVGIKQLAESLNKSEKPMAQDGEEQFEEGMALVVGSKNKKNNYLLAYQKFIQAASHGQPDALFCLGVFYENGFSVSRNKSIAYVFYKLAATIAGEDYMKMAEKALDSTCRSDENEAAYQRALDEFRIGKDVNSNFAYVTSLKDVEADVANNNQPNVTPIRHPEVAITGPDDKKLTVESTGSGLIFSNEGYFFTNHHVVENGKAFTIKIAGVGEMRKATLVAIDPVYDLAILKIENWRGVSEMGQPIPSMLSNSKGTITGVKIFTVGYPLAGNDLDCSPKYTSGDLSSMSSGNESWQAGRMLVTCPIQPGNSGGPIVTESGQVVGVVCSTFRTLNYLKRNGSLPQGMNFAVRIEYLRQLAERNSVKIPEPSVRVVNPVKVITANSILVYNWQ